MKINVLQVIIDHLSTLRNDASGKILISDMFTFFGVPVIGGALGYITCLTISKDFCNVSVTFFGVFVALLLNFQVAAFGIYNRRWGLDNTDKLTEIQLNDLDTRRILLRELNANISYLITISAFSIMLFLTLYALERTGRTVSAICWTIYLHFMLTLMMVVKRSHILFRREYEET